MNDTLPETTTDTEAPDCWPPLAHIFEGARKARPGDRAVCGAKLMGIDLNDAPGVKLCQKCLDIVERQGGGRL